MKKQRIEWHKVTWYSWVAAVIVFGGVYLAGFHVGRVYERANPTLPDMPMAAQGSTW